MGPSLVATGPALQKRRAAQAAFFSDFAAPGSDFNIRVSADGDLRTLQKHYVIEMVPKGCAPKTYTGARFVIGTGE